MPATIEENLLSSILPKVTIDSITLSNTSPDVLKINLKLVVKEVLDNNFFGTWFDGINIKKYIIINTVQSIDSRVTRALSFSNDMIKICDSSNVNKNDMTTKAFGYILNETKIENIIKILKETTLLKTISMSRDTDGDNKIEKYSSYVDNDGNKIYEIPYDVNFQLYGLQPEHLSYFVVTKIDLNSFCSDFGIKYDTAKNISEIGKVYCETVIDANKIIGISYVYLDEQQRVWEGPVHQDSAGNWKTGNDESSQDSKRLTLVETTNTKIQDFRNIAEIQKKVFNFDNIENIFKKIYTGIKPQSIQNIMLNKKNTNFSNIFLSKNSNRTTTFSFGINFYNVLKNNSKFFNLFYSNNSRFKQESIKNIKILNLNILRRRIKNNIKLKNNVADFDLEKFDLNEPDYLVLNTKDISWKNLISIDDQKGSFTEISSFKTFEDSYKSIRFFTGTDKKFTEMTDGIYQYGIELEIEDGITTFIQEKINALESSKSKLVKYYNEINSSKDGYNLLTNKLNAKLIQQLNTRYLSGNSILSAPWIEPLSIFVDVLDTFSEDIKTQKDRFLIIESLCGYLSPQSANPESILKIIELFDYLISSISKVSGLSPTSSVNNFNDSVSEVSGKTLKSFKVVYFFNELIDSNMMDNYGLDYLSTANPLQYSNKNYGLTVMDSQIYTERVNNEILKYFKSTTPNLFIPLGTNDVLNFDVQNISYAYLSPTRIDFGSRSTMMSAIQIDENIALLKDRTEINTLQDLNKNGIYSYLELHSNILESKLSNTGRKTSRRAKHKPKLSKSIDKADLKLKETEHQTANNLIDLLANYGNITINPINIEFEKNENGFLNKNINIKNFFEDKDKYNINELYGFLSALFNPIITDSVKKSGTASVNNKNKISSFGERPLKDVAQQLAGIKIERTIGSQKDTLLGFKKPITQKEFEYIPNQLKGLIFKSGDLKSEISDNLKYDNFRNNMLNKQINYYNFNMLMQVEYLSGFSKLQGTQEIDINKPIWKIFTKQVLEQMGDGEQVMCRIKSYANSALGISYNRDAEENCYDKYFIILNNTKRVASRLLPVRTPSNIFADRIIDDFVKQIPQVQVNVVSNSKDVKNLNIIPEIVEVTKIDSNNNKETITIRKKKPDSLINLISSDIEKTPTGEVSELSNITVQTAILQLQNMSIKNSIKNTSFVPSTNINKNNVSIAQQKTSSISRTIKR